MPKSTLPSRGLSMGKAVCSVLTVELYHLLYSTIIAPPSIPL